MRIIAGSMKGRKLISPKGDGVRPTADKVKEAIFSMLGGDLDGAVVIDPFAGSGNLGLEALSRGAARCYFCDNSRDSIKLVKSNIEICGADSESRVIAGSFEKALSGIHEKADVIFLDPPYKKGLIESCLAKINEFGVLRDGGVIVAEHGGFSDLGDTVSGFGKIKEKKYGTILVSLYG